MSQYQKHPRNATSALLYRLLGLAIALLVYVTLPGLFSPTWLSLFAQSPVLDDNVELRLPVLVPAESANLTLHTHLVDIVLEAIEGGGTQLRLNALYELRNDEKTPAAVSVRLLGDGFSIVTLDDVPLTFASGENGEEIGQFEVAAGESAELQLNYSSELGRQAVQKIVYPVSSITQWNGPTSMRVDLTPGISVDTESWLGIEPDSWSYAPPGQTDDTALQWLYDGNLPGDIAFAFVDPILWQQLQQADQAVESEATPEAYGALGDRYARIANAAAAAGNGPAAARFRAQAVAAYTAGLRNSTARGASPIDMAPLHAALAALYRGQVVDARGATDAAYAELMVLESGAALTGIMADDLRRPELENWQAEGLRLLLTDARRRDDITAALALIDRLAASPAGAANAEFLANEREALLVQQGLTLLEQGDRQAALAVAGDTIGDPTLQPAHEARSLFVRWTITARITDGGIELIAEMTPSDMRSEEARQLLDELVQRWRENPATRAIAVEVSEGEADAVSAERDLRASFRLPKGANGVALSQSISTRADWALLRVLLSQLGPVIESQNEGLSRGLHVSQPIDLRGAGDAWKTMAATLEQQADELEAQAAGTTGASTTTLESSLAARVQAANYRSAAQVWRDLARESSVEISLRTEGSLSGAARSWLVTVASPPQMLDIQVQALDMRGVFLVTLGLLAGLFVLASVLWRLL